MHYLWVGWLTLPFKFSAHGSSWGQPLSTAVRDSWSGYLNPGPLLKVMWHSLPAAHQKAREDASVAFCLPSSAFSPTLLMIHSFSDIRMQLLWASNVDCTPVALRSASGLHYCISTPEVYPASCVQQQTTRFSDCPGWETAIVELHRLHHINQ